MRFQEYGNRENPTLVMLQPMLMNPSAFNFVIPQCSKNLLRLRKLLLALKNGYRNIVVDM